MPTEPLDELDFSILQLLQSDARHTSPVDMENKLPVTDTTIRNRIDKLEERGIIEGYVPQINYEKAGFPLRVKFVCTAPVQNRAELAQEALSLPHVVHVEEMLSARENVRILVVSTNAEDLHEITSLIDTMGLTIEHESLLRRLHTRPFNHFGEDNISSE